MRSLKVVGWGFVALVLAGGWAFFFLHSRGASPEAANGALAALRELREIDARWNNRLIRLRDAPAAGAMLSPAPSFGRPLARLELELARMAAPGRELGPLRLAFEEKTAALQRFEAVAGAARAGETEAVAAARAAFDAAWYAGTGPRLDLVARVVERAFDDALAEAELYRAWLLYYSAFLLVVLGWLIWTVVESRRALDRANAALHETNEGLEQRVEVRTAELSSALARLKESEAMLVQSEKMSSLGQMVAGIVHEVNTPLAYVKASLETVAGRAPGMTRFAAETSRLLDLLAAEVPDERALAAQFETVRALAEEVSGKGGMAVIDTLVKDGLHGVGQISELVGNLKNFSRLDRSRVAEFDLREGLESALRITRHELRHRQVQTSWGELPKVSCSPSQINQVFLNLLTNAAQATKDGEGRIILRTLMRDPAHVAVEISDNGSGIAPEVLPKIFDPFFTTKPVGKGTGLGLSISYRIVESHGGRLEVQSRPGVGTRFTVVLPVQPPAGTAVAA